MTDERMMHDPWTRRPPRRRRLDDTVSAAAAEGVVTAPAEVPVGAAPAHERDRPPAPERSGRPAGG